MTFPKRVHRNTLVPFGLAFAAVVTGATGADASEPMSVYSVPTKVELLPDEVNPTRVIIRGSFFFLNSTNSMTYGDPTCGAMYFECKPGESTLCRMQWNEIRTQIGGNVCVGFGQKNAISTAMVRPLGEAIGSPYAWDLGMGINLGSYVDGQCPKARAAQCSASSDAGIRPPLADAGAGGTSAGGTNGMAAQGGTMGSTSGSGGTPGTTGAATSGRVDAGVELEHGGSGCAIARKGASDVLWLYALAAVGWMLARRRGGARRS